jgi:RNA polymerase sigma-70 factor (ECF subfamily)
MEPPMDLEAELECIARFKNGDESAFNDLFEAHHPQTLALARRFSMNESLALDIAQEAYLLAFQELRRWRGEARFSTWLHRTTINVAMDHIRRECRQQKIKELELGERSESPEDLAAREETRSCIDSAVHSLPPRQRTVFRLRRYAGMTLEEITAKLGITEGGVKANYARAVYALRIHLRALAQR